VLSRRLISWISPLIVASKARAFAAGSWSDSPLPGPVQYWMAASTWLRQNARSAPAWTCSSRS